ncbi:MAG: hypothetical protein ACUVRE_00390 [Thermoanaerobaculaceae bacterium]
MTSRILSWPVVTSSIGLAVLAWVFLWWLLPIAQGLGTWGTGGSFIGLSVPTWTQPWALVNEPSVGFAATRTALWAYWLAPFLLAAFLVFCSLQLPAGTSLLRHLFLVHLAWGASFLGLAWLAGLGLEDGLISGLARFFHLNPKAVLAGLQVLAGVGTRFPAVTLASYLWHLPQGPTPGRRLLLWLFHLLPVAVLWVCLAVLAAPRVPMISVALGAVTTLSALLWLVIAKPPHPRRQRELLRAAPLLTWGLVFLFATPSFFAFSHWKGRPLGFLWGKEGLTSNVRQQVLRVPLKRLLFPESPPARFSPGS